MTTTDQWLEWLYHRVDINLTMARNGYTGTHQWIITLTIAGLTAVLAVNGDDFRYPTEQSLVIVLLLFPLMLRFFVRSCLEYTIFYRWLRLRDGLDFYFNKARMGKKTKKDGAALARVIDICLIGTRSVRPMRKMIYDNLRMAFLWPMLIVLGLLAYGLMYQDLTPTLTIVLIAVAAVTAYEVQEFARYPRFRYEPL